MKTKALISCAVTMQLICTFVCAYAKSRFSHDMAQIVKEMRKPALNLCESQFHKGDISTGVPAQYKHFTVHYLSSIIYNLRQVSYHNQRRTRFDVYETLCPKQMLVHKGGQIKNWSGECRDLIPTKLQCQAIQRAFQSPNLQREIIRKKKKKTYFSNFHQLIS